MSNKYTSNLFEPFITHLISIDFIASEYSNAFGFTYNYYTVSRDSVLD